jgi:diguanylate cyclase (GGDEF)-like protein/PAS domain S-box-containing protein
MPTPDAPDDRELSTLFTSLVEESADAMVVVHDDGSIRYMNAAAGAVTGWDPEEGRGRSIFELVHPEDVDRAIYDLTVHAAPGAPPGWSSYRVLTGDGSWLTMQLTTAEVSDGSNHLVATYCRAADVSAAEVLFGLLRGKSPLDALRPVLDMFNRKVFGSRVAITWIDDAGVHHLGTDVPAELAGADDDPDSPWAISRTSGEGHRSHDLTTLDDGRRALAARHQLGAYWIEPVVLEHGDSYALITVWTRVGGPPPEYHSSGMRAAKDFVELILRWTRQVELLDAAAHRDALTGLANRKAFFDSLSEGEAGAVLYCDLDRFKPVNDELGHRAGDELLSAVAGRIQGCVRTDDIVARLGGDEFAVLCEGATEAQAAELAERIRAAVEQPFEVGGATARVGISIGVAHVTSRLGDAVLESADRALYQAKAEGGSAVRWNEAVVD